MTTPSPMLAEVIRVARAAGELIEEHRRRGLVARDKPDRSPVTEADLAADRLIGAALQAAFPAEPIVSEESRDVPGAGAATWVVDPIDGTEAFIDPKIRGYAVQIARVVAGRATLGVVYEPAVDELFYAEAGEGAWLVQGGGTPERVHTSRGVEPPRLVTSTRVAPGFREALFARGLVDGGLFRSVGVKVGRVARGLAEVYPATHGLSVWDIAGPIAVLEEAGGRMTDLEGRAPSLSCAPGEREYAEPLVATHGPSHEHWCEVLREMRARRR
ncbi:MAG: 3'(2'),5'-bisphosphate nucleotidase CysQ [Deltaproteobacteria bacterium]|nr:3'(2'),5'-bisphosphate nucleotidase CysQ [Deltaproteobacteria bacterium]